MICVVTEGKTDCPSITGRQYSGKISVYAVLSRQFQGLWVFYSFVVICFVLCFAVLGIKPTALLGKH
jgi:hypothetical protein